MKKIKVFFTFVLFFIIQYASYGQCSVSLGNDRTICAGTEITLTATGNAVLYEWSISETGGNIVVDPVVETEYTVLATCADGTTSSDLITVFVNPLPEISLGNDTAICLNDSLELFANGGIHYLWSNGSTNDNITVAPSFTTDYSLLLIDINNCQNSDTITVDVNPLPTLTICDDQEICSGDMATLVVTTGAPVYFWNTGEATSVISVSPFETSNYVVTVIDENECKNTDTTQVAVTGNPVADFSFIEPCELSATVFTDLSTDEENVITNWNWDFDDSNNDVNQNPSHTYTSSGVFDVQLIVTSNKNCKDTVTKSVQVFAKPVANFSLSNNSSCNIPAILQLTDETTNATSWSWNFGNDETSTEQFPSTIYNEVGQYQIQLIAESSHSCFDTAYKYFEVFQKPILDFTADHTQGCEPLNVEFSNQSQYYDTCYWYIDEQFYYSNEANHTFVGDNFYTITLQAENENCTEILTKQDYIEVFLKPTSGFEFSPDSICGYPVEIQFDDTSLNTDFWKYTFDTGDTSHLQNPSQSFDTSAVFNIIQIVETTNHCLDTALQTFTVFQDPIVDFETDISSGCEPSLVTITNKTLYGAVYNWEVDNKIFTDSNLVYEFIGEGFYNIKLKSISKDGCEVSLLKTDYIEVYNKPILDFVWTEETNPFPYGLVYFDNYTEDANTYIWNFGDSIVSTEFEPEHRYDTYGDFIITQIAIDTISGCSDTLVEEIYVDYFDGLFVPNAFMPDAGIGEEKFFLPKGKHLTNYQILIYNNSGNLMWESTELSFGCPAEGWDGMYNGKPMPQGVYFWKINATFENELEWRGQPDENGKYKTTGFLTLIR